MSGHSPVGNDEDVEILGAVPFFGLGLVAVVAGVATTVYSRRVA